MTLAWQSLSVERAVPHQTSLTGLLREIALHIPDGKQSLTKLEPEIYERILLDFLRTDVDRFLACVRKWSFDLYKDKEEVILAHVTRESQVKYYLSPAQWQ